MPQPPPRLRRQFLALLDRLPAQVGVLRHGAGAIPQMLPVPRPSPARTASCTCGVVPVGAAMVPSDGRMFFVLSGAAMPADGFQSAPSHALLGRVGVVLAWIGRTIWPQRQNGWQQRCGGSHHAAEQGDEADEGRLERRRGIVVGGAALGCDRGRSSKVAPFAAYPRCSADLWRRGHVEANPGADTALRLSSSDGAAASPVLAWCSGAPCFSRRGAIAWS